jgi:hypothetical protein
VSDQSGAPAAKGGGRILYRRHDWLDTKTMEPRFGIQAKAVGWEVRWLHCAQDNVPLIFYTPQERDAKLKELRRAARLPSSKPSSPGRSPASNGRDVQRRDDSHGV